MAVAGAAVAGRTPQLRAHQRQRQCPAKSSSKASATRTGCRRTVSRPAHNGVHRPLIGESQRRMTSGPIHRKIRQLQRLRRAAQRTQARPSVRDDRIDARVLKSASSTTRSGCTICGCRRTSAAFPKRSASRRLAAAFGHSRAWRGKNVSTTSPVCLRHRRGRARGIARRPVAIHGLPASLVPAPPRESSGCARRSITLAGRQQHATSRGVSSR
jgi:hypothetical protein